MANFIVLRDENFNRRMQADPIGLESLGMGSTVSRSGSLPPAPAIAVEDMSKSDVEDMRRDPAVRAITRRMPIRLISPVGSSTASDTGTTWGVAAVGADTSPVDGAGVKVAVLDTGIDPSHDAFTGVTLDMKNFSGGPDSATDGQGHGTHCAGTIFGRDVDGLRIGVAPGITAALIGKVLDDEGSGSSEMLFEGMKWAQASGARVISMSLGFDFPGLVDRLIGEGWPPVLAG
ncbi:MAG: S8 family serine peptidase, partial [Pseudomonadota bacterium]